MAELTAKEAKQLRRLLKKLGRPDLIKELAPPRPRRARGPTYNDGPMLRALEVYLRVCMRDHGMKRTKALRMLATAIEGPRFNENTGKTETSPVMAQSINALVSRWRKALRAAGYHEYSPEQLWPPGFDHARVTLFPERWTGE